MSSSPEKEPHPEVWQYAQTADAPQALLGKGTQNNYFGIVNNVYLEKVAIPLNLATHDPQPVFDAVDVAAFTGRNWLADKRSIVLLDSIRVVIFSSMLRQA